MTEQPDGRYQGDVPLAVDTSDDWDAPAPVESVEDSEPVELDEDPDADVYDPEDAHNLDDEDLDGVEVEDDGEEYEEV